MPKVTERQTRAREVEIMEACKKLYRTMSFKEITIKEIGNVTTFTRTSIYNYFQTKEEIFLALLKQEYEIWVEELKDVAAEQDEITKAEFAEILASTLSKRGLLLKVLAMNMYDIEENSRVEKLVEFKSAYKLALDTVGECLKKAVPQMSEAEIDNFIYSFFPFIFGIYPYTNVTDKQREAMRSAGLNYRYMSIYDITLMCAKKLLGVE